MAEQNQLDMLRKGTDDWNAWRNQHPLIQPNLREAHLREAQLSRAHLREAQLSRADLSRADLSRAHLNGADLSGANLNEADLNEAHLIRAHLDETRLEKAIFKMTIVGVTHFANVDLRSVIGLETIVHKAPSTIGIDTLFRSEGHIPEIFLRKAGVPEDFITYIRSLVAHPIEYYTCFISYSSHNQDFAERLYTDLQSQGIRCWFAPEDMKIGDKIRQRIDESIRLYDKLLLVLSEFSVASEWVEFEVEAALEKERKVKHTVLFPIRLDNQVMQSDTAWAADIRRSRHIGDLTRWKDHDSYQQGLKRLLRDLHDKTVERNTP